MTKEKQLCCPHCGSDDLAFQTWVDENNNFLSDGVNRVHRGYVSCTNSECVACNDEIKPVNKDDI